VSAKRKILWRVDGEAVLRAFARWCALQVIDKWGAPDVVVEFLRTGDEKLRDAAWSAARDAAWSAAWSADWSAAWSAARSADWYADWDAQNKQLEQMTREAYDGKTEWIFN
jgi:hypothetical protein